MELTQIKAKAEAIESELKKTLKGQDDLVRHMLIALFSSGHILLEGAPGTAKTWATNCFAACLSLDFGRVQFTPDLMPGDIIGSSLFNFQSSSFTLNKGPIFTDILLADEINRSPPKTQAALLEAMQERNVTLDGERHKLSSDFMVIATQNPIEQQGVYPLPEAQLDRFLFKYLVGFPNEEDERAVISLFGHGNSAQNPQNSGISPQLTRDELHDIRNTIGGVTMIDDIVNYILRLVRATRENVDLEHGASPRAGVMLARAARANAAINGRDFVIADDVKMLAVPALRHRIILTPAAEIDGKNAENIIGHIVEQIDAPR